jgi:hypothetical protein
LGKADKAKAAAASGVSVFHHDGFLDRAEFLKLLTQGAIIRVPGKTSDE